MAARPHGRRMAPTDRAAHHGIEAGLRGVIRFCRAARSVGAILRRCGRAAIQVRPCDARRLPGRPRGAEYESRLGGLPAQFDPSHDEIPKWPAYTQEQCATMFLDAECK